jgi:hypothetical protein
MYRLSLVGRHRWLVIRCLFDIRAAQFSTEFYYFSKILSLIQMFICSVIIAVFIQHALILVGVVNDVVFFTRILLLLVSSKKGFLLGILVLVL